MQIMSTIVQIHRVVSCFLIRKSQRRQPQCHVNITTTVQDAKSTAISTGDAGTSSCTSSLPPSVEVAVFRRQSTMPTFPSHWAPCSGSIETSSGIDECPWDAANRELHEETNLDADVRPEKHHGLYVDVDVSRSGSTDDDAPKKKKIIRVYPFVVRLSVEQAEKLELQGTEHDTFQFVTPTELDELQPSVPALSEAFHHATFGKYYSIASGLDKTGVDDDASSSAIQQIRDWANDYESGAATMTRKAMQLLQRLVESEKDDKPRRDRMTKEYASLMIVMRPSMVAITNALRKVIESEGAIVPQHVIEELDDQARQVVKLAVDTILAIAKERLSQQPERTLRIATFSRSSTLIAILQTFQKELHLLSSSMEIVCSKSTPGDEGLFMAEDLRATCVDDDEMIRTVDRYDIVLVGADCVLPDVVVNKIGTKALVEAVADLKSNSSNRSSDYNVPVCLCCADRFKLWDDMYPPPLEDVFELVPKGLFDSVLIPSA